MILPDSPARPDPAGEARGAPGLHARLRAATGPAHRALEDALDWRARVATLDGYRGLLTRLHGFHAAWEPAVAAALADEPFLAPRRRLALAAADLGHLGLTAGAIAALPRPAPIPLDGAPAAMGALYVLEGSTLGGQVVGRHVAAALGLRDAGLAYYRAHGPRTGAMWAAFRARLDTFGGRPAEDAAAIGAAVATFDALRAWLCGSDARPESGPSPAAGAGGSATRAFFAEVDAGSA